MRRRDRSWRCGDCPRDRFLDDLLLEPWRLESETVRDDFAGDNRRRLSSDTCRVSDRVAFYK